MNVTLLTGSPQITQDSSILDRLALGGSTTLLGMAIVFSVLCIIFIALQIMRAVFTKNASQTKKARKAEKAEKAENTLLGNADELKKYKDLLDSGIITQEEFDAKKKQLLGL